MTGAPADGKAVMRRAMLAQMRAQNAQAYAQASRMASDRLLVLPAVQAAGLVLVYIPLPGELDTGRVVAGLRSRQQRVAIPVVTQDPEATVVCEWRPDAPLVSGVHGVQQPADVAACTIPLESVECAIIPGVAFDRSGYRLGRGGGYYDRLLTRLPEGVARIGVAFLFQLVDRLPHAAHDQRVHQVIVG